MFKKLRCKIFGHKVALVEFPPSDGRLHNKTAFISCQRCDLEAWRIQHRSDQEVAAVKIDAEMALLGGLLLKGSHTRATSVLDPMCFTSSRNREIFVSMGNVFDGGKDLDVISLTEQLKGRGTFESCGGAGYITELIDKVHTTENIDYYARMVSAPN